MIRLFTLAIFLAGCGDSFPGMRESLYAEKAIVSVDRAETEYFKAHDRFGTLSELDSVEGASIHPDLDRARNSGFVFQLNLTADGYEISVRTARHDAPYLRHSVGGSASLPDPAIDDRLVDRPGWPGREK